MVLGGGVWCVGGKGMLFPEPLGTELKPSEMSSCPRFGLL